MSRRVPVFIVFSLMGRRVLVSGTLPAAKDADVEARVSALLCKMTVAEKIGRLSQLNGADGGIP